MSNIKLALSCNISVAACLLRCCRLMASRALPPASAAPAGGRRSSRLVSSEFSLTFAYLPFTFTTHRWHVAPLYPHLCPQPQERATFTVYLQTDQQRVLAGGSGGTLWHVYIVPTHLISFGWEEIIVLCTYKIYHYIPFTALPHTFGLYIGCLHTFSTLRFTTPQAQPRFIPNILAFIHARCWSLVHILFSILPFAVEA